MHINDILDLPNLQDIKARFDALHTKDPETGCWLWRTVPKTSYPAMPINGRPPKGKVFRAANIGYVLYRGPWPPSQTKRTLVGRHSCDNHRCVNPWHITPGTQRENHDDMKMRDRSNRGERNGHAVLTPEQVEAIRADKRKQRDIADDYGISQANVSMIKTGRNWKHLA